MSPKKKSLFGVAAVIAVGAALGACQKVVTECTSCGHPTEPSTPVVALHPTVTLVFVTAGVSEVRCREPLVIQGQGFTPSREVVIRVTKSGGLYNDFPEQGRPRLFADGSGAFQFTLEYERFWDTGSYALRAYDVQTGAWTPMSQEFAVNGCGGGPRPTPTPTPTPSPTPTPPPCVPAPSLSVSPTTGSPGTLFKLLATGLCPGAEVTWTIQPFPVVTTTAAADGTSTWTYNSSGDVSGTTRSGYVTSGGKSSNAVSWTIQ